MNTVFPRSSPETVKRKTAYLPPTVRSKSFQARDGKIVSHRMYWDSAALLAQLGVLPAPVG